jgi:hypothetical protein
MQHYSLEDWADFARNVAGDEKKITMQSHLETGCKPCTKVHALWQRVNQTGQRESAYEPPETAVSTVKGLGAIHAIAKPRKASSKLAELLFDSFSSPLQAGVRSSTSADRQVLYGAGDYRIDMRMEPQTDSEKVAIVGQVLNAINPAEQSASAPIILFKGNRIVSTSQTNSFGEFHLECELAEDLKLHFVFPGGANVLVPLISPAAAINEQKIDSKGVKSLTRNVRRSTKGTV